MPGKRRIRLGSAQDCEKNGNRRGEASGYHPRSLMKSMLLSGWVSGLGLLAACSGEAGGPRDVEPGASGGANASAGVTAVSGTSPLGTSGTTTTVAGTSAGGAGAQGGTTGTPPKVCGPAWVAGTSYAEGAIVSYQGSYFIAEHENPGYDPLISTYFWEPYQCEGGGGGGAPPSGGTGNMPSGESSFDDVVSEQLFNELFPQRNAFYTYQGLVDATKFYPAFAGTGSADDRKREAAAFLANVARETGELVYIEQIQKDAYCQPSEACPCAPGKQYFGRGPIQISWNYNYCAAGAALGLDLVSDPDAVAQSATIAWETGLWFWMTQSGAGTATPHVNITTGAGFGETIRNINGGQECGGKWPEAITSRVSFYQRFCTVLGVSPGDKQEC
jgi:predicted chitinase